MVVTFPASIPVSGYVHPGFECVRDAFIANFTENRELGAAFAAIVDNRVIVDLHGGWSDRDRQNAWTEDTIVPVYSTTKPVAALVLARLIDKLPAGYETFASMLWPEFAANGKAHVTIGQIVSHQAGLPGFVDPVDPAIWLDPPACAAALAACAPLWTPGTVHGYHPLSWGYMVGTLVARIDGRSLGTILREDITKPFGIDFHIGTSKADHHRIAQIRRPRALPDLGTINMATRAAFLNKWAAPDKSGSLWREIEIPSANGIGTAMALARLYGIYACGGMLDNQRVISRNAFAALTESRVTGPDLVLPFITEFAAGVMRNNLRIYGPNPNTLCHSGWGGSLALADPDQHLSVAYVMNRQDNTLVGDTRGTSIVKALYSCL